MTKKKYDPMEAVLAAASVPELRAALSKVAAEDVDQDRLDEKLGELSK